MMSRGRMDFEGRLIWGPMSLLVALTHNVHRDPKKTKAKNPDDFNPYATQDKRKRKGDVIPGDITALKLLLPRHKRK